MVDNSPTAPTAVHGGARGARMGTLDGWDPRGCWWPDGGQLRSLLPPRPCSHAATIGRSRPIPRTVPHEQQPGRLLDLESHEPIDRVRSQVSWQPSPPLPV
jgi:hypothetical protein